MLPIHLRHLKEGAAVKVILMSYGEKGSILTIGGVERKAAHKRVRIAEVRRRFQLAPSMELGVMDVPDMEIGKTEDLIVRSLQEMERFRPTCMYLPESTREASYYGHSDHIAPGQIGESAAARYPSPIRLRYFHSRNPNIFVDMTPFYREKENLTALRCCESQYQWNTSIPFLLHLYEVDRYLRTRRYGKKVGSRFAEAFREMRGA